jgi:hypothetical protein
MKTTVTKTEFKSWLETKTPGALVGIAGEGESCPLAMYFRTINGVKKGKVEIDGSVTIYDKNGDSKSTYTKPWMNKFIEKVDGWPESEENKTKSDRITAKRALDILAQC